MFIYLVNLNYKESFKTKLKKTLERYWDETMKTTFTKNSPQNQYYQWKLFQNLLKTATLKGRRKTFTSSDRVKCAEI